MKKFIKIISMVLVVSTMFTSLALAADANDIMLLGNSDAFVQTSHTSDLDVDTGLYLYGADVIAKTGATSTYVSCVIQRRENGVYVNVPGSWISVSRQSDYASVGNQRYVTKGYWYRTQATYIVHINGQEYKVVDNSNQYWYG